MTTGGSEEGRTQVCHDMPQLSSADESIAILVEDFKRLLDLLFAIGITHLPRHHGEEFREIDGAVSICINFVNHVLELCFRGILAKGTHDGAQFLGRDSAIAIFLERGEKGETISCDGLAKRRKALTLIEEGEGLLEL